MGFEKIGDVLKRVVDNKRQEELDLGDEKQKEEAAKRRTEEPVREEDRPTPKDPNQGELDLS